MQEIITEIREILDWKRKELQLTFIEEDHKYYMLDIDGVLKTNFPSVSTVIGYFYTHFDKYGKALEMCNGNVAEQQLLINKWDASGSFATNMGSRVHFELETHTVQLNGNYKDVRKPIFEINSEQKKKSDGMIRAGKEFLQLMAKRNCFLLDTEMVLGDPELGYTGQPDKIWLVLNKNNTLSICITDWKTNKPEKFISQWYTKKLYPPFNSYDDTPLTHYYVQLPLYGKLLKKMLKGTKYEYMEISGCIVVLLKENGTFQEFRVPYDIIKTIMDMDIRQHIDNNSL